MGLTLLRLVAFVLLSVAALIVFTVAACKGMIGPWAATWITLAVIGLIIKPNADNVDACMDALRDDPRCR